MPTFLDELLGGSAARFGPIPNQASIPGSGSRGGASGGQTPKISGPGGMSGGWSGGGKGDADWGGEGKGRGGDEGSMMHGERPAVGAGTAVSHGNSFRGSLHMSGFRNLGGTATGAAHTPPDGDLRTGLQTSRNLTPSGGGGSSGLAGGVDSSGAGNTSTPHTSVAVTIPRRGADVEDPQKKIEELRADIARLEAEMRATKAWPRNPS